MSRNAIDNNKVSVTGKIVSGFTYSHEVYGEGFFLVDVKVSRLSDQADIIPLLVSDRLIDISENYIGRTVEAAGQFRSYNFHESAGSHLVLSVFVRHIRFLDEFTDYTKANRIFLNGRLCKAPVHRMTPLGREIADLILAVNRPFGKSDYIPCIAWGHNASYISGFGVGTRLRVWGRVQSREYSKKLDETQYEKRVAYEVSVNRLETAAPAYYMEAGYRSCLADAAAQPRLMDAAVPSRMADAAAQSRMMDAAVPSRLAEPASRFHGFI